MREIAPPLYEGWRQPDAAMFASSWLRKVSNTCSSHARRNGFNEIDNGTKAGTLVSPGACPWVTRMCLLSGRRVVGGPCKHLLGAFLTTMLRLLASLDVRLRPEPAI